jgi:glyceraldehyde 3-phosphate dehydrogenase
MKIAINGFGRIGRVVARQLFTNPTLKDKIQLIAVNDLAEPSDLAFSLKYDSTHGKMPLEVTSDAESITVGGKKFACLKISNPNELPWAKLGVDLVLECTGRYVDKESASAHLKAGAKKVIISAPAKGVDLTVVMGVNQDKYNPSEHHVLSNASCTTNCLAPIVATLHKEFGVKYGFMTTVHSYTSDQRILDNIHKDPRRARTAATNLIPTTTGAAKAVGEVIPELKGKLDGFSVRVPTPNVSLTDFVAELNKEVSVEEVNNALIKAAKGNLKGVMDVSLEPLVSSDYNGSTFSSIIDAQCTKVTGNNGSTRGSMVKVYSWYDNETGFSARMLELAALIGSKL